MELSSPIPFHNSKHELSLALIQSELPALLEWVLFYSIITLIYIQINTFKICKHKSAEEQAHSQMLYEIMNA